MNKLLDRQVQKYVGDHGQLPENFMKLLAVISESYDHYEKDRKMLERSIDLSSNEMIGLNAKLRQESDDLKKAHLELNTLFENIDEVFFSIGFPKLQLLQISPSCEKAFGYKIEDFKNSPMLWHELALEEDKKIIHSNIRSLYSGKPFVYEYRIHHKNGSVRWVETKITPTLGSTGELIRIDGIVADITSRMDEELMKKNIAELRKANSELDKFVYSVSHDLRAPLTSMLGIIDISLRMTKEPIIEKHFGMLRKSVTKLDGFILDILDYSRNARVEVKKEEIHFNEKLNEIIDHLKYMNERQVDIKVTVNNGVLFKSDATRLNIVLNNLISNALRYQNPKQENPYVNVQVDVFEHEAVIAVKDNGIGISKENQPKVFDMFYRVSEHSVGSGLGLYIMKETIDKLKGRVEIESELDKGTTFKIYVPNSNQQN